MNDKVFVELELNKGIFDELKSVLSEANRIRAVNECSGDFPLNMMIEFGMLHEIAKLRESIEKSKKVNGVKDES
jgi:hypothetical protein